MPRVSVVVPCSSQKEEITTTVASILNQTSRDFELLISDDGSTDGTGPEMLQVLGPDPSRAEKVWRESLHEGTGTRCIQMFHSQIPILYLNQVLARGKGAARNRAIDATSGQYVAFAEPGDVWMRKRLGVLVEVMERHRDLHAIVGPGEPPPRRQGRKKPVPSLVEFEETILPPGLCLSGSILRRNCLESEAPFDENLTSCEDFDFWLRIGSQFQIGRLADVYHTPGNGKRATPWSQDRYRVYSLEKAFQSGHLSPLQRHRVAEVLVDRCGRLANGYRQRENAERSSFYERKKKRFIAEVEKLDVSDPLFSGRRNGRRRLTGAATG
jgi:glycosyltransferase involved in cell wall biosynthesis